jgi:hypothetical protein
VKFFFIGWHQPVNGRSGCDAFDYCMISVNRLLRRRSHFPVQNWIMDSGAFSRITSGKGHLSTRRYAKEVLRWKDCENLMAAVTQDYMCEEFVLGKTGLSIEQHQRATIARYDNLLRLIGGDVYLMPVLQGYAPQDYVKHLKMYGDRLPAGAWVGVGSVCKRNGSPKAIEAVLLAIYQERPDLRLHGFGIKKTALGSGIVRDLLWSADSQASSFNERATGGNANCPLAAMRYANEIKKQTTQLSIWSTGLRN